MNYPGTSSNILYFTYFFRLPINGFWDSEPCSLYLPLPRLLRIVLATGVLPTVPWHIRHGTDLPIALKVNSGKQAGTGFQFGSTLPSVSASGMIEMLLIRCALSRKAATADRLHGRQPASFCDK
jgi:hypothetical protein